MSRPLKVIHWLCGDCGLSHDTCREARECYSCKEENDKINKIIKTNGKKEKK
jgi:hypothetical protein